MAGFFRKGIRKFWRKGLDQKIEEIEAKLSKIADSLDGFYHDFEEEIREYSDKHRIDWMHLAFSEFDVLHELKRQYKDCFLIVPTFAVYKPNSIILCIIK